MAYCTRGGGGARNGSVSPAWLAALRKDVRISSFATAGARVLFLWVCLIEGCILSEVFHQTAVIQLDETLRNFKRREIQGTWFLVYK